MYWNFTCTSFDILSIAKLVTSPKIKFELYFTHCWFWISVPFPHTQKKYFKKMEEGQNVAELTYWHLNAQQSTSSFDFNSAVV